MNSPYLSIIIPAYNEAKRLPETLALVRNWVEQQPWPTEVLVVDDGSRDATVAVCKEMMCRFPALSIVEHQQNQGKGAAVRTGMLKAQGAWRLFMDADASTPIHYIDSLLREVGQHEVVIGSRYLVKGSIKVKQPLKRRVVSRLGNLMIRVAVLPGIIDTQCGFKLFSANAAEAIFSRLHTAGWLFDVEVLSVARALGYAVKEVPVEWYDARDSRVRALRAGSSAMKELLAIRRRSRHAAKRR